MKKRSSACSAFFNFRVLLGVTLGFLGVALAIFAGRDGVLSGPNGPNRGNISSALPDQPHYMPVPGPDVREAGAGLAQLEQFWFDCLTFPTGRFNPAWVRAADRQHKRMPRGMPFGREMKLNLANPFVLSTTNWTALGPQPEHMTGCSGCFDYTKTEGRVNTIAVDPTT